MITQKQEIKLLERVRSLSELEMQSFIEELIDHLEKHKMLHLIIGNTDYEEEIEKLEDKIEELESEIEDKDNTLEQIQDICSDADEIEEFEESAFDELKDGFKSIKKLL